MEVTLRETQLGADLQVISREVGATVWNPATSVRDLTELTSAHK